MLSSKVISRLVLERRELQYFWPNFIVWPDFMQFAAVAAQHFGK